MLTYELKKAPGMPLYEALYRCIRQDILSGELAPGEKLPSKRALAQHLKVSKITVEGAYEQLLAEGYIQSREKVGYFVEPGFSDQKPSDIFDPNDEKNPVFDSFLKAEKKPSDIFDPNSEKTPIFDPFSNSQLSTLNSHPPAPVDLVTNSTARFPFSVWSRLQRQLMLDVGEGLLSPVPNQGLWELRLAIARQLHQFQGLTVRPENILIGAGTDFLYNLLIQLLGRDKVYAVEEPGYGKIRRIYGAGGVACTGAPMDSQGVIPEALETAQVLHISPSHHFPTGTVTTAARRQALIRWARSAPDRWIIEDDYDSEFRFRSRPMTAMVTMDPARVIYMNTFSKTLTASIRISYMVLPADLMARFQETLGFYSCTVPVFEQYTLERFLRQGYFEKHINRMRKIYKSRRNRIMNIISACPLSHKMTILEQDAGLHFLLKVDTRFSDGELVQRFRAAGIRIQSLGSYYHEKEPGDTGCLVVNYSGLSEADMTELETALTKLKL